MKRIALAVALASVAVDAGCVFDRRVVPLKDTVVEQQDRIDHLNRELLAAQGVVAAQRRQIVRLQDLGPARLDMLFTVNDIELGRYTGGYSEKGSPVDAGVRVYLVPVDAAGSPLKAAGDVTIQLYDLASGAEGNLVGEYSFPVATIGEHWYGGLLTNYYRFDCPWPNSKPPGHPDITVRAVFLDYLTGKEFTHQDAYTVMLATETQPAQNQPGE